MIGNLRPGTLLILGGLSVLPRTLIAQAPEDSGHGERAPLVDLREFSAEERERLDHLQSILLCACRKEGWSKTLNGCPEGCAEPQKNVIRAAVKAGKSDQQIIDEQVRTWSERVKAIPDSTLSRLVPFLALSALTMVVLFLLVRSVRRKGDGDKEAEWSRPPLGAQATAADRAREKDLGDAVERDLAEMDE